MRMNSMVLLAAVLLVPVLSGEEGKKPAKDEDAIKGAWTMESGTRGGEAASEKLVKNFRVTFAADGKLTVRTKDKDEEGTFKLDATKKPKEINFGVNGKNLEGIYTLEGDTLKLCVAEEGGRPAEFKSPEGTKTMLMTLKREKK